MSANKRNPNSDPYLQMALDMADRGLGKLDMDSLIIKLRNDPKFAADMQKVWNSHRYPEKSLVWAQLGIEQQLFKLPDAAFKVLIFLGMYCHQTGLVQVKLGDICTALDIGRTLAKQCITTLRSCGAIDIAIPSVRHAAPIYRVNPLLVNKGSRRKADATDFTAALQISPDAYILNQDADLVIQTDAVRTDAIAFNRVYLVPPDEAKPVKKRPSKRKQQIEEQLPGQMTFEDAFPEVFDHGKSAD